MDLDLDQTTPPLSGVQGVRAGNDQSSSSVQDGPGSLAGVFIFLFSKSRLKLG